MALDAEASDVDAEPLLGRDVVVDRGGVEVGHADGREDPASHDEVDRRPDVQPPGGGRPALALGEHTDGGVEEPATAATCGTGGEGKDGEKDQVTHWTLHELGGPFHDVRIVNGGVILAKKRISVKGGAP